MATDVLVLFCPIRVIGQGIICASSKGDRRWCGATGGVLQRAAATVVGERGCVDRLAFSTAQNGILQRQA